MKITKDKKTREKRLWDSNIDTMACAGYDYAVSEKKLQMPDFATDMNLMAFNAGISNANIKHGLNINPISITSSNVSIEGRFHESDKTLGILWGIK